MTATTTPPLTPTVVRVRASRRETHDAFTLTLDLPRLDWSARPGQFNMLYAFGVGEAAISVSGDLAVPGAVLHTIRAVGSVTKALERLQTGQALGVRGPFGSPWPLDDADGRDVVLVAGGIGLAPLRPALYHLLRQRDRHGRLILLYGARTPADILYGDEFDDWRRQGLEVLTTVDCGDATWRGPVGLVTALFSRIEFDPTRVLGLMCGPEIMMRFVQREFARRGVGEDRLHVTLERNMQCAVGFCGHCQLGPAFVCVDGPVFRYDRIEKFFNLREA